MNASNSVFATDEPNWYPSKTPLRTVALLESTRNEARTVWLFWAADWKLSETLYMPLPCETEV